MIENPDQYIEAFAKAGADYITVHVEACPHLAPNDSINSFFRCETRCCIKSTYTN